MFLSEEPFKGAKAGAKLGEKQPDKQSIKLWGKAFAQADKSWLEGPIPFAGSDKLLANGWKAIANPPFRFRLQQAGKLIADAAASVHTPMNIPSRGHPVQLCELFRFREESRPLACAKADHADACGRLPHANARRVISCSY